MPSSHELVCVRAAFWASQSHRLLSSWAACPLVQIQFVLWISTNSSSSIQRSALRTGWFFFHQWRRFHRITHCVIPCRTYSASVVISTSHGSLNARSPWIAAINSIRLLVVRASYPKSSFLIAPNRRMQAHPPGPGFPRHDPSVIRKAFFIAFDTHHDKCGPSWRSRRRKALFSGVRECTFARSRLGCILIIGPGNLPANEFAALVISNETSVGGQSRCGHIVAQFEC